MKYYKLSFLFLIALCFQNVNAQTAANNTYAVIVGVSNYESIGIRKLKFANNDARNFYNYLLSKSGGSVPPRNIKLLVDEEASFAAIYQELKWLLKKAKKDDLVYFYFSGHGDMENTTIYKLGFLLAQNTPRTNYINNALRIEDLNYYANTLSTKNEAKVILITDACHSGNLAGNDFRGNQLVGNQLRAVEANEVRITSCGPNELSAENAAWGKGSGVFSYYLLNGLQALADENKDGSVNINEIEKFLKTRFAEDEILKRDSLKQTPVLNAKNKNFKLSVVDKSIVDSVQMVFAAGLAEQKKETGTEAEQLQRFVLKLLKNRNPEDQFDFLKLNKLPKNEIINDILSQLMERTSSGETERIKRFIQLLKDDKDELAVFTDNVIVLLHGRGQNIINLYLEGDAAELERRRYYNSKKSNYDIYPVMFDVALKLTDSTDLLNRTLKINKYYFGAVASRVAIPLAEDPTELIAKAFSQIRTALALEDKAAYIYNELGLLYKLRKQYDSAEINFLKAVQIAPAWAIPQANLAGLYATTNNYEKGFKAAEKAKQLQPDFQNTYINSGLLYEKTGNQLMAEELYRKSIKMNSRHYFPFERLGYIYMNTTDYALADSFFNEADIRKKNFNVKALLDTDGDGVIDAMDRENIPCYFDSAHVSRTDIMGNLVIGIIALQRGDYVTAERKFKEVIMLDKKNPLVFHYLGKLLYEQQRWKEGEIIFNYAFDNFKDKASFKKHFEELKKLLPATKSKNCILEKYAASEYEKIEDRYFLGTLYERWNHFAEAEQQYLLIIKANKKFIGGYFKLWSLLEATDRYTEAENTIRSFSYENKKQGQNELNTFYKRMTAKFPEDAAWHHKAGLFLYDIVASNPNAFPLDKKYFPPDKDNEVFVDAEADKTTVSDSTIDLPGINELISPADSILHPMSDGIDYLVKVDSLTKQEDVLAEINYKLGDLYVWQGLPEKASPCYKKSIALKPKDANTRTKLVQAYSSTYLFQNAFEQLDTLKMRKEINFSMQLLLSKYLIHSGEFGKAETLLRETESIHPFELDDIADLYGRFKLLSKKPADALVWYKKYLAVNPNDFSTIYTIAKLYAQSGNKTEALKWLENSIQKGFRYLYILQFDTAWEEYRSNENWKTVVGKIKPKVYAAP
jgi:tetratricopeptide (TPR) repeat protein